MFLDFFNLRQQPFGVTPDPVYLFPSETHCHALDALTDGITSGRGFLALIAEPGMGKTTLLYQMLEGMRDKARAAYLFQTQCTSREFFEYLLSELGVDSNGMGLVAMHNKLNEMLFAEMLAGRRFVLIVDEAQNLDDDVLETIRLLSNFETSNTKLLQIILAGQPQLAEKLNHPRLAQLLQRLTVVQHLEALTPEESAGYIRHRLKIGGNSEDEIFDRNALAAIAALSAGVPRNINRICYNSLLEAHAQGARTVTPDIVTQANRQHDLLIFAAPPPLAPEPDAGSAGSDSVKAAAASAGGPTPLTYKPLSGLRPRGRNWWQGGAVAALLLAGAAATASAIALHKRPGNILHAVRDRVMPTFSALAVHASDSGRFTLAGLAHSQEADDRIQTHGVSDAIEIDPLADALRPASGGMLNVNGIEVSSGPDDARVTVLVDDSIRYDSARISSPDRIYFDLHNARLSPSVGQRTAPPEDGLLKWVRAAQNTDDVVRLVLDADGAKDYSAQMLANPYRLVIDLHARASANGTTASSSNPPQQSNTLLASSAAPPAAENRPSLTRALGLKISRIAIDPGHGGSDTGAMGPHGLVEKNLCLDVALRLGQLIGKNISGAEVVYTRKDDRFVPLEERTAIANRANADLFISIHANSSDVQDARGVETYYLNLSASPDAMRLATRENALAETSLHDLPTLLGKIEQNVKITESKQLAAEIQDALSARLQLVSHGETNRGVKQAPFVVLTGATMPAILSEISFVSNASDESLLLESAQRQRIAEGLYRGVAAYLDSLNSLPLSKEKLLSENRQHTSSARNLEGSAIAKTP
jgi:N-acetylmuramoyl-L-alanine amidase/type II secretory pathway predicted ATPase ExeA